MKRKSFVSILIVLLALFRRMKFCFGSSPISVAIFLFSTLALASYFEPVAGFEASQ